ncbi:uncharacterized protein LOC123523453 [Mercenaria mercenaria]|uniref:uncharacterized protein LOC123523453 n=1 Tax=Mercenaria mercenaria TaxID=6596 RepID=UPI00234F27A1|nr:uncharacterized protein LOC123523453 [Mercenaria mercenaria]
MYSHITSCSFRGVLAVSFSGQDDGITTGTELLADFSSKCSNQSFLEPYYSCLNNIIALCPHQSTALFAALAEKLSFFCDGNRVSSLLQTVLQAGYSYNVHCDIVLSVVANECAQEILSPDNMAEDMSLSTAPKMLSVMFACVNSRFSGMSDDELTCGSSREDIVLRFWIQVLADGPLGFSLSESQRKELQDFITRQKQRVSIVDILQTASK